MNAVYAGSFDPVTLGHLDIIIRASKMFSHLYVAIGVNPTKSYIFPEETRKQFIENQIPDYLRSRITVLSFNGLLADFAYEHNISVVVRGARSGSEFDDEVTLSSINNSLKSIETVILPSKPEYRHVSSSAVKAINAEWGDLSGYVPLEVKSAMEKHRGYHLVGVIGHSGSGKTTLVKNLIKQSPKVGYWLIASKEVADSVPHTMIHINLDQLGHELYESSEPFAVRIREQIIDYFSHLGIGKTGMITPEDRKIIGKFVFTYPTELEVLTRITQPGIQFLFRREIRKYCNDKRYKAGYNSNIDVPLTFLVDGAIYRDFSIVNNQVIEVMCDESERIDRIMSRDDLTKDEARDRLHSQYRLTNQHKYIDDVISDSGYGFNIVASTNLNNEPSEIVYKSLSTVGLY